MTHIIEITDELNAYFCDKQTKAAVDFVVNSPQTSWLELSVNEFENNSPSEKRYEGYKNYSDAWLYSTKVQKDFFDFVTNVWALSWKNLLSRRFIEKLQPEKIWGVEGVWEDHEWEIKFNTKNNELYDNIWIYCQFIKGDRETHIIRLKFSLGKDDDYKMSNLTPPENWTRFIDKKLNEDYFVKDCKFDISNKEVRIFGIAESMKEAETYLQAEILKT